MFLHSALVALSVLIICTSAYAAQLDALSEQPNVMNTVEGQDSTVPPLSKEETLDALIANSSPPPPLTEPVRVRSGMLSVKLEAAPFGRTLEEIGRQAGFEAVVSDEVASKELTTAFRDVELHKGIQRLLSLLSHRNFFIYYGPDDSIKKIEVYSTASGQNPNTTKTTTGTRRTVQNVRQQRGTATGGGVQGRQNIRRPGASTRTPASRSPITRRAPKALPDGVQRVYEPEVPYIVPRQEPQFIPPYNKNR